MGFLTDLTRGLRDELARHPLDEGALLARASVRPPARDFEASLRASELPAIIAEVKRASPSAGPIAEDADPVARAQAYETGGAAAVSVLTEARHFHGSLTDLEAVRLAVRLPLLRKDFIVHPSQVIESRAHGADAVLLITSCCSDAELTALLAAAADLGLGVLLETHSDRDLDRALATDAPVIGVNARDLETLEVDVEGAPRAAGPDRTGSRRGHGERHHRWPGGPRRGRRGRVCHPGGRGPDACGRSPGPACGPEDARGDDDMSPPTAIAEGSTPARPDVRGRFGDYGGRYVPEVLIPALDELADAWSRLKADEAFRRELGGLSRDFVGRPTPITRAARLSDELGYDLWLKREDLAHTGAHKINNALGQALIAKRLGKERIIAETGAGQHGVASATACALLGLPCVVYMGEEDIRRQAPNVARMKLLGAEVVPVTAGTRTLKEAVNEALRDWAGLGHHDALHHRIGRRPPPVPRARARPPARDR